MNNNGNNPDLSSPFSHSIGTTKFNELGVSFTSFMYLFLSKSLSLFVSWSTKDSLCKFGIMLCSTLIPFGSVGATSGTRSLDGIFNFGASVRLGRIYGGNKVLVSKFSY